MPTQIEEVGAPRGLAAQVPQSTHQRPRDRAVIGPGDADVVQEQVHTPAGALSGGLKTLLSGATIWWIPLLFLAALTLMVGAYAASQSDTFLKAINIRYILLATAPAAMVAKPGRRAAENARSAILGVLRGHPNVDHQRHRHDQQQRHRQ